MDKLLHKAEKIKLNILSLHLVGRNYVPSYQSEKKMWQLAVRTHNDTLHIPGVEGVTVLGETTEAAGVTGVVVA